MNSQFIKTIQSIYYLEEELITLLKERIEVIEFPARYKLLKSDSIANKIFFVEKG